MWRKTEIHSLWEPMNIPRSDLRYKGKSHNKNPGCPLRKMPRPSQVGTRTVAMNSVRIQGVCKTNKGAGLQRKHLINRVASLPKVQSCVPSVSAKLSDLVFLSCIGTVHNLTTLTFFGLFHKPLLSTHQGKVWDLWGAWQNGLRSSCC